MGPARRLILVGPRFPGVYSRRASWGWCENGWLCGVDCRSIPAGVTPLTFTLAVFGIAVAAGVLGSLLGLGGGIIVVPALTLLFKIDIRYAIGASLVSVI